MSADPSNPRRRLPALALLTAACVLAGFLARIWQLGKWPLAIDEYYLVSSVQNILHFGIPQYPCGGLYVRGLLLQYSSAALQISGLSPELAPRIVAAVTSLATLPAAFLIGRRIGGRDVALLAVIVLALSVWEIEIGRFGRMYAPFQALFAWYCVFFLAYSIDGKRSALLPMLLLSAAGVWVWEGGVFLVIANLLPPFIAHPDGRLRARDWKYLAGVCLLFIPVYPLAMADWLTFHSEPLFPPGYGTGPDTPSPSRLDAGVAPWTTLLGQPVWTALHPAWVAVAAVPAALVLWALRSLPRTSPSPLAAAGLSLVLLSAVLQQFALAAGLLILMTLLGIADLRALLRPAQRPIAIALLACVLFWTVFGLATTAWHQAGLPPLKAALLLGYEFVRFPDLLREVAMPWGRTVPVLASGLFVLLGAALIRACWRPEQTAPAERVILVIFVILLMIASAVHPPRHETRYVFFLYPLAIVIALTTLTRAARALLGQTPLAAAAAVVACLGAFALSEDFRPAHLWNIATEAINFRIGMPGRLAGHYHPRSDVRAAADWLRAHARPGEDTVINSFPAVDFYYRATNYYYVSDSDPRFEAYSCRRGTVQRWSNLPLLHNPAALEAQVATGRKVWLVLETERMPQLLQQFPRSQWTLEWTSHARDISIVALQRPTG